MIQGARSLAIEIFPPFEVFYIHALLFHAQSALNSLASVSEAVEEAVKGIDEDGLGKLDQDWVLNHLQSAVVHAAAISRYFWPVRKGHEYRGAAIRAALQITDASPLKNRELRNQIEHFDEKLDEYLANGVVGMVVPHYVGPAPEESEVPGHIFRAFFSDTGVFVLLGKKYEIQPIADELIRVYELLKEMDRQGGRLTAPILSGHRKSKARQW